MKRFLIIIVLCFPLFFTNFVLGHVNHYKNVKYLEYEVFLNNDLIGSHKFNFSKKGDLLNVNTAGEFKVSKLGLNLMNYKTNTEEIYKNGKLIIFKSKTTQNDKIKYVNLTLNKQENMFEIDGSSFKGKSQTSTIIGSWWNHDIIKKNKQISPISGRIISQKVKFLGKEKLNLYNQKYNGLHFHFLSDDDKPLNKKKINLHVWYDTNTLLWIKMSYDKLGHWEYRLKKQLFY
tara:strand:+ start:3115 stop:3810 length:696 start_codon:yes stop_codon:yes gene_type:complete